jgi:hypothetical protein
MAPSWSASRLRSCAGAGRCKQKKGTGGQREQAGAIERSSSVAALEETLKNARKANGDHQHEMGPGG